MKARTLAYVATTSSFMKCSTHTPSDGKSNAFSTPCSSITASRALFRPHGISAAMPSRAMLGKHVRVTDLRTGRSVLVLVNDIGPAKWSGRIIDLSRAAAVRLGIMARGQFRV